MKRLVYPLFEYWVDLVVLALILWDLDWLINDGVLSLDQFAVALGIFILLTVYRRAIRA